MVSRSHKAADAISSCIIPLIGMNERRSIFSSMAKSAHYSCDARDEDLDCCDENLDDFDDQEELLLVENNNNNNNNNNTIIDNQELIANIKMLAEMLGENNNTAQQQPELAQDEISCLTDSSFPLSDIYELAENDIILLRPEDTQNYNDHPQQHHNGQHAERFRQLLADYADLYRSSRSEEEKLIVVTEVVQMWRSQEPAGRFLTRTEPERGEASPYHDIGDDTARERTARLLLLVADDDPLSLSSLLRISSNDKTTTKDPKRRRCKGGNQQNHDDRTASTSASSSSSNPWNTAITSSFSSSSGSCHGTKKERLSQTTVSSTNQWNRHNNPDGECFGGMFRMIVMSFFNKQVTMVS